jgi:hypothetical protein
MPEAECLVTTVSVTSETTNSNSLLPTFKLEGETTSLSESSQGEVGDNKEKWGDFWEKLIAINRNILSRPL